MSCDTDRTPVVWIMGHIFLLSPSSIQHQHLPVLLHTDTLPFPFKFTPIPLLSVLQRELANTTCALRLSGSRDTDKTTCSDSFLEQKGHLRLINNQGRQEALRFATKGIHSGNYDSTHKRSNACVTSCADTNTLNCCSNHLASAKRPRCKQPWDPRKKHLINVKDHA